VGEAYSISMDGGVATLGDTVKRAIEFLRLTWV
jgi:hypothetical protein